MKIRKITKKTENKKLRQIFDFLVKNINNTTFELFGYNFFLDTLKINSKNCFYIQNKNGTLLSYISYINIKNEIKIKRLILRYIIKNPIKYSILILINYKFLFKIHKPQKNYIQLLHLVIKSINKNSKKMLHNKISKLHELIVINNYEGIYACYSNNNIIARKYYSKNLYKIFNQNIFFTYVQKKIN